MKGIKHYVLPVLSLLAPQFAQANGADNRVPEPSCVTECLAEYQEHMRPMCESNCMPALPADAPIEHASGSFEATTQKKPSPVSKTASAPHSCDPTCDEEQAEPVNEDPQLAPRMPLHLSGDLGIGVERISRDYDNNTSSLIANPVIAGTLIGRFGPGYLRPDFVLSAQHTLGDRHLRLAQFALPRSEYEKNDGKDVTYARTHVAIDANLPIPRVDEISVICGLGYTDELRSLADTSSRYSTRASRVTGNVGAAVDFSSMGTPLEVAVTYERDGLGGSKFEGTFTEHDQQQRIIPASKYTDVLTGQVTGALGPMRFTVAYNKTLKDNPFTVGRYVGAEEAIGGHIRYDDPAWGFDLHAEQTIIDAKKTGTNEKELALGAQFFVKWGDQ